MLSVGVLSIGILRMVQDSFRTLIPIHYNLGLPFQTTPNLKKYGRSFDLP
jgi:hypothetical protein